MPRARQAADLAERRVVGPALLVLVAGRRGAGVRQCTVHALPAAIGGAAPDRLEGVPGAMAPPVDEVPLEAFGERVLAPRDEREDVGVDEPVHQPGIVEGRAAHALGGPPPEHAHALHREARVGLGLCHLDELVGSRPDWQRLLGTDLVLDALAPPNVLGDDPFEAAFGGDDAEAHLKLEVLDDLCRCSGAWPLSVRLRPETSGCRPGCHVGGDIGVGLAGRLPLDALLGEPLEVLLGQGHGTSWSPRREAAPGPRSHAAWASERAASTVFSPSSFPPLGAEAVDALAEVLLEPLGVGEAAEELVTGADAVRLEGKQVVGIGCRALGQAPEDRRHWATCRAEMAAAGVQALSRSAGTAARCTRTQLLAEREGPRAPPRGGALDPVTAAGWRAGCDASPWWSSPAPECAAAP